MRREQTFAGDGKARRSIGLDQHRLAAERGEDMAVRRITGHRDRYPVAGLEHGEKAQDESARRSRGDHDPFRIDVAAVGLAVVPGDAPAQ